MRAMLCLVVALLTMLVGRVEARGVHCVPSLTLGVSLAGFRGHQAEFLPEIGGAGICRVTPKIELLLEVALGRDLLSGDKPGFAPSFTLAALYEPHHSVRVGGFLTGALSLPGEHTVGELAVGPAVQVSAVPHRLDFMLTGGPALQLGGEHASVGWITSLHAEIPLSIRLGGHEVF